MGSKCPYTYKWQLVEWAIKRWPSTPGCTFKKMKKFQLYAIFYNAANEGSQMPFCSNVFVN